MDENYERKLVAALETLPRLTRAVFLLNCRDDFPYVEIGWRCGISVDEVTVRMSDALLAIDRAMHKRPSLSGRIRRALLPYRDAWAATRAREGDRQLAPWPPRERSPARRRPLDWVAWAYELL
ncbi:MAG TPA: sigma-70 region 4 domain-containing protein [Sphingomicrobium sp.]|jgi:hypothetical protein|nr:sigma-70 region 4 domain-containing protein [Sphingomicrobium sp.]